MSFQEDAHFSFHLLLSSPLTSFSSLSLSLLTGHHVWLKGHTQVLIRIREYLLILKVRPTVPLMLTVEVSEQ